MIRSCLFLCNNHTKSKLNIGLVRNTHLNDPHHQKLRFLWISCYNHGKIGVGFSCRGNEKCGYGGKIGLPNGDVRRGFSGSSCSTSVDGDEKWGDGGVETGHVNIEFTRMSEMSSDCGRNEKWGDGGIEHLNDTRSVVYSAKDIRPTELRLDDNMTVGDTRYRKVRVFGLDSNICRDFGSCTNGGGNETMYDTGNVRKSVEGRLGGHVMVGDIRNKFSGAMLSSFPLGKSWFAAKWMVSTSSLDCGRSFSSKVGGDEKWGDEDIEYLDETGSVIYSGKGIRSVQPGVDDHVMVGNLKMTFSNANAVSKIVEVVKRWKWGPEMESQLDKLHFVPNMSHVNQAMKEIKERDACVSLFKWAKRQSWYTLTDDSYVVLFDKLNTARDFEGIQSLFDDMMKEWTESGKSSGVSFLSYNRVIQHLARAEKLEVAFCCFKKVRDIGFKIDTQSYNSLIAMFLNKSLPYKAFEIYEAMEVSKCSLDERTYEFMIPNLATSGRLDAAIKLFQEMKEKDIRPSFAVFASLVDSMGKAGRLDMSMKVYMEMQGFGMRPSAPLFVSLIESYVKAGKLEMAMRLWAEMKKAGFRPNYGLYTMIVESHAKSGKLEVATSVFSDMEKAGFLPTPSTYSCLLDMQCSTGQVDSAMKIYNSMTNAGLRPGLSTYTALLTVLANKKLVDVAAKILLEMKAAGFSVDVSASDILMIYIKDGSVDLALRWLRFMGSSGLRTNNFIIRSLFESCMKNGLFESAAPLLDTYIKSGANVDLILYTSVLAHLVRCQDEENEKYLMAILSSTKHKAHSFMCGLFTGPEQRKQPVLTFVRDFFKELDMEVEEGSARYFVNVLLNYLVLMGQINRARCFWKVAYENKLFPKAIVFDQHIAWSLDVRNLSVGAALIAVIHTLHRFRKRMLYYGVVPRRIKLVTGPTLKIVIAQILNSVESPFEVSKVVLRAPGDSVLEWFKKPIVQQFLLNEIPSRSDLLMHKLNILFPSSAPDLRSLYPPKPLVRHTRPM